MRVLLVSQEFPPETGWGGIGTYLGVLAPALVRAGAEVHVLSVVEGQERSDREIDGVQVHRAPLRRPRGIGRLSRLPLTWQRVSLARAVAREAKGLGVAFDVCESPEWNAEALALAIRRTMPVVVRLHSGASQLFPHIGPVGRDKRLAIRCEHSLIRRADVVTGTTAQTADVPGRLGIDPAAVRTITCPIDREELLELPAGPPTVLFAGRFEARKGADLAIRALPRVLERVPDARLVLRGTDTGAADGGSYAAGLWALIRDLGVAESVEVVDRWNRGAVAEELARAMVCVVPSRWESFGYVAAEACVRGRPVVATRTPALAELVVDGETGRLVDADNSDDLAGALGDLLADPDKTRELGLAAADRIATHCDPDRVATVTMDAYEVARARWRRSS